MADPILIIPPATSPSLNLYAASPSAIAAPIPGINFPKPLASPLGFIILAAPFGVCSILSTAAVACFGFTFAALSFLGLRGVFFTLLSCSVGISFRFVGCITPLGGFSQLGTGSGKSVTSSPILPAASRNSLISAGDINPDSHMSYRAPAPPIFS